MSPAQPGSPAARILKAVPPLARLIASEVRRAGADLQLTLPQFSALRLLADHDCSVGEMARTLHVALPTVTQIVDGLVSKGLAQRSSVEQDRRQVWLRITDEGRRVMHECRRAVEAFLADALASSPKERQDTIASEIERLLAMVREASAAQRL